MKKIVRKITKQSVSNFWRKCVFIYNISKPIIWAFWTNESRKNIIMFV